MWYLPLLSEFTSRCGIFVVSNWKPFRLSFYRLDLAARSLPCSRPPSLIITEYIRGSSSLIPVSFCFSLPFFWLFWWSSDLTDITLQYRQARGPLGGGAAQIWGVRRLLSSVSQPLYWLHSILPQTQDLQTKTRPTSDGLWCQIEWRLQPLNRVLWKYLAFWSSK